MAKRDAIALWEKPGFFPQPRYSDKSLRETRFLMTKRRDRILKKREILAITNIYEKDLPQVKRGLLLIESKMTIHFFCLNIRRDFHGILSRGFDRKQNRIIFTLWIVF